MSKVNDLYESEWAMSCFVAHCFVPYKTVLYSLAGNKQATKQDNALECLKLL